MKRLTLLFVLLAVLAPVTRAGAAPEGRSEAPAGQVTWGVHTTLVPSYFDRSPFS